MRGWKNETRPNAVLRKTEDGWRFICYAEAAKSTLAYLHDVYEAMATEEFRQRFKNDNARNDLTTPPGA